MRTGEMITLIEQADRQGFSSLVDTVNQIQDSIKREPIPVDVLYRLGLIVQYRLKTGRMPNNFLGRFLNLHNSHLERDLKAAKLFRESVVAVSNFCISDMRRVVEANKGNIGNKYLLEVARSLLAFRYRDDQLLSAIAEYFIAPPDARVPWVEDIGEFLEVAAMFGYFNERQYIALLHRATYTAKGFQHEQLMHQGLTKVIWAQLLRGQEEAFKALDTANQLINPAALNFRSLLRLNQVYFANRLEVDAKFAELVQVAEADQVATRNQRRSSTFENSVELALEELAVDYEKEIPVAGYWVDFLIDLFGEVVVLECDHPLFHEMEHLRSAKRVKSGEDIIRDTVLTAKYRVIRLSTIEWNEAVNKVELLLDKLYA